MCTLRPYHVMQVPQLEFCKPRNLGEEGVQTCGLEDRPRVYARLHSVLRSINH